MTFPTSSQPKFVFFGTPEIAVTALDEMEVSGVRPSLIVCNPDAPSGRKQVMTAPPVKTWALERNIPIIQPASLTNKTDLVALTEQPWDFFVVFAYGKIIPAWLLDVPRYGTINAHPSLLPKLRGASPIRSTLLNDPAAAGVTIIQMDAELDHGPILAQTPIPLPKAVPGRTLDTVAGRLCGDMLVHVMRELPDGQMRPQPQDHAMATYCTKIAKNMAELALDPRHLPHGDEAAAIYRKICAFDGWPGTFFIHNNTRININDATLDDSGALVISTVTPAGKKRQPFSQWLKNIT